MSPQFLVGFQKRYFCIRDHGQKLIYYAEKPKLKDKPKGVIEIKDISEIWNKNKTDFCLQYEERRFELRAANEEECEKWIFVLSFLRERIKKKNEILMENAPIKITFDSEVRSSEINHNSKEKKEKWRVSNLDEQTFNDIQAEHEINLIKNVGTENHFPQIQESELQTDDNHILEVKGIKEHIDKIDPEILRTRICMGFLEKKRKKLSIYQKRWCILISPKPFISCESRNPEISPLLPDVLITEEQLPPWMELDTIYYFQYKANDDKSPFIRKIPLRNFISISMHNQQHSEDTNEGYGFNLITKERKFAFRAELITEMNKWITAIEGSRKNFLETHVSPKQPKLDEESETANLTAIPHKVQIRENTFGKCPGVLDDFSVEKNSDEDQTRGTTIVERSDVRVSVGPREEKGEKSIVKEGYMMKKSMHKFHKLLGWEQRYVTLKNDSFFWSMSNTNVERRNTISLAILVKCETRKEDQFVLTLEKKVYKFKADNQEDRDKWVALIKKAMIQLSQDKQEKGDLAPVSQMQRMGKTDLLHPKLSSFAGRSQSSTTIPLFMAQKNSSLVIPKPLDEKERVSVRETEDSLQGDEDTIFNKFFVLCEDNNNNKPKTSEEDIKFQETLQFNKGSEGPNCFYKYLCCCLVKPVEEEEDYYSHF